MAVIIRKKSLAELLMITLSNIFSDLKTDNIYIDLSAGKSSLEMAHQVYSFNESKANAII